MDLSDPGRRVCLRKTFAWVALLVLALGLRVGFAIRVPNVFHPDEIYQTLEPAHRLAYGSGAISWEWRVGVRSWVLPTFLAGAMRATGWMGSGSAGYIDGIIVLLSLASLSTVWFGYVWGRRVSGREAALIAAGACSLFLGLIYFAPKALTETVATDFLLPGLYLGVYGDRNNEKWRLFFAGIFCGMAAAVRIQLIPAVVFAAIYFCYPRWRSRIPAVAAGLSIPVLAFGLVDKITWSYPWQSFYRNFQTNVFDGRSLVYGSKPWYWYLLVLLLLLGPVVVFLWNGARRSPFLAAVLLIILGSHSLLSHKEVRFIYPLLPLAITIASIGFVESLAKIRVRLKLPEFSKAVVATGVFCFVLSSVAIIPIMIEKCQPPGAVLAFDQLSRDPALCGVAFDRVFWWQTGGYTHLHRNVPIIPVQNGADIVNKASAFNALVAPVAASEVPVSFERGDCWNGICVYRRAGVCKAPKPEDTLNAFLQRTGH